MRKLKRRWIIAAALLLGAAGDEADQAIIRDLDFFAQMELMQDTEALTYLQARVAEPAHGKLAPAPAGGGSDVRSKEGSPGDANPS